MARSTLVGLMGVLASILCLTVALGEYLAKSGALQVPMLLLFL